MSAKSHPGDGSYGKGVKGCRPEFEELFEKKNDDSPVSVATHAEPQHEAKE